MGIAQSPTFALLLRRHRQATQLTQEELAERAGLSVRAISDLERGVRQPRKDTLQLLLEALQLAPDERARMEAAAREGADPSAQAEQAGRLLQPGSYLGALPPGPLVGRLQERSRIQAVVDGVRGGSGRLLLLTGEPGVGKTRLAQEVSLAAQHRGFLVATGRCYEPEQTVPFYSMVEALATAYVAAPHAIREETPRRWPYLSRLLPDQDLALSLPSFGGQEEQQWLFRAVSGFLQAIAEEMPVALLLDDVHWADSSSLKLLLHLVRHTRGDRVLVVGTYRDTDVHRGHPLERALIDLNRERLLERMVVRRLEPQETATLIAATLGEAGVSTEVADLVHRYTNGNPFFIQEVIRTLAERGDLFQQVGHWAIRNIQEIRAPESVHSTISERLARLPPGTQAVLYEASVLGQSFTFEDLQRINQRQEEEVEEALEEAAAVGLVHEVGDDHYAFHHALTQQALYDDLSAHRRRRLHLAVAEALERLPEQPRNQRAGELARHFMEGAEPERALPYALLAGDQAQQVFAYGEAERYYRLVLELGSAVGPSSQPAEPAGGSAWEVEGLAKLGGVLNIMQQYDKALEVLEQAAELYGRRGDLDRQGVIIAETGWIHHLGGTAEEGIARIYPLIDSLEQNPARHFPLACFYTALTRLYFSLGKYEEELAAAERASDEARAADSDFLRALTATRRGAALMTLGRGDEARQVLQEAIGLAETTAGLSSTGAGLLANWAAGDGLPFLRSRGSGLLENLAQIERDGGEFERSRQYLERALELAEQGGNPGRTGWALVKLGGLAFLLGDWPAARAYLGRANRIFGSTDTSQKSVYCRLHVAQLRLAEGDLEEATESLDTIIRRADTRRDLWLLRQAQRLLAERDLMEAQPESALSRLEPLLDRPGLQEPQVTALLPLLAWAHLQLGHETEAEEVLMRCLERASAQSHRLAAVDAIRIRGMLRTQQGQWNEACSAFDAVASLAQSMPYPYARAQALYESGMTHVCMGEPGQAREQLQHALAIFQRLGAGPYAKRTEQALAELD